MYIFMPTYLNNWLMWRKTSSTYKKPNSGHTVEIMLSLPPDQQEARQLDAVRRVKKYTIEKYGPYRPAALESRSFEGVL